jgi:hypothetical protein
VMRAGQANGGKPPEAWDKGVEDLREAARMRPDQYQPQASLAAAYLLIDRLDDAARYHYSATTVWTSVKNSIKNLHPDVERRL